LINIIIQFTTLLQSDQALIELPEIIN
jgi:hypothetical protein